jgi:LDH2 family malate/lactate/ureidoglycolate dehydrogenase
MADQSRPYGQWWDWEGDMDTVPINELRALCGTIFSRVGASPDDAALLTACVLEKTIQGDHARGIINLPSMVHSAQAGTMSVTSEVQVLHDLGAAAVVGPLGRVPPGPDDLVCHGAMRIAIEKARRFGVGLVSARAGIRILTPIVRAAADAGMIGVSFTQSTPAVAPLGGKEARLGNAPTAVAIPARDRDPIILDLSLTNTSTAGLLLSARQHQKVPAGFILDPDGEPTIEPRDVFAGDLDATTGHPKFIGSVLPLGGEHKGYGLVYVIGLLASVLSDTSPAWDLVAGEVAGAWGSVHLAINVAALNPADLLGQVDAFIDTVAATPRRRGVDEILYPGQGSQRIRRAKEQAGTVDVPVPQLRELAATARELGVDVPRWLT